MKIPKRIYIAAAVLLFVGGAGTGAALVLNSGPGTKKVEVVSSVEPQEEQTPVVETQPVVVQPVTQTAREETPPSITNPFQEGFSIWYVFNRRAEVGKSMPTKWTVEQAFCTHLDQPGYVASRQPTQHAIGCSGQNTHMSFVEQVNEDGSIWVSEMNGSGQVSMTDPTPAKGWNVLDYKLISSQTLVNYKFLQ